MFGMNSGTKMKIFVINPRAFFTACFCHDFNLLLGHAKENFIRSKEGGIC
jgi:hypothetical protein